MPNDMQTTPPVRISHRLRVGLGPTGGLPLVKGPNGPSPIVTRHGARRRYQSPAPQPLPLVFFFLTNFNGWGAVVFGPEADQKVSCGYGPPAAGILRRAKAGGARSLSGSVRGSGRAPWWAVGRGQCLAGVYETWKDVGGLNSAVLPDVKNALAIVNPIYRTTISVAIFPYPWAFDSP